MEELVLDVEDVPVGAAIRAAADDVLGEGPGREGAGAVGVGKHVGQAGVSDDVRVDGGLALDIEDVPVGHGRRRGGVGKEPHHDSEGADQRKGEPSHPYSPPRMDTRLILHRFLQEAQPNGSFGTGKDGPTQKLAKAAIVRILTEPAAQSACRSALVTGVAAQRRKIHVVMPAANDGRSPLREFDVNLCRIGSDGGDRRRRSRSFGAALRRGLHRGSGWGEAVVHYSSVPSVFRDS